MRTRWAESDTGLEREGFSQLTSSQFESLHKPRPYLLKSTSRSVFPLYSALTAQRFLHLRTITVIRKVQDEACFCSHQ